MSNTVTTSRSLASDHGHSRMWLYDRSGNDQPLDEFDSLPDLRDDQILWADFDYEGLEGHQDLIDHLGIAEQVTSIDHVSSPSLVHEDGMLHVVIEAIREDDHQTRTLHALVGTNWIVTVHDEDLEVVEKFNEPLVGDTRIGDLDGAKFLSLVLDWLLNGYLKAASGLHDRIDELDEKLLQTSPNEETLLQRLLELRREVRRLRYLLASHRDVLALLSHPESDVIVGSDAADDYRRLEARLQQALDEVATAREMIVGSFDIFMTRTAQATNDVMRRLTIVSVLLLPAVVIAGVMGMNFRVGFFETTWLFWVVIGVMALLGGVTLVIAKKRGWY